MMDLSYLEDDALSSYVPKRSMSNTSTSLTRRSKLGSSVQSPTMVSPTARRESQETGTSPSQDEEFRTNLADSMSVGADNSVEKWFVEQMRYRKLLTGLCTGAAGYIIFLGTFLALQFSIWAPFRTIGEIVWGAFCLKLHLIVFVTSAALGVISFFLATLLVEVDQQKHLSMAKSDTWKALFSSIMFNLAAYFTALNSFFDYSSVISIGIFHFIFVLGTVISSILNIFTHDYQLIFGALKLKSIFIITIYNLIIGNISLSVGQSFYEGVLVLAGTLIASFFIFPFICGLSGLIFLFDFNGHYALAVIFTAQLLIGHVFHRIIRQKILEPIHFSFPPPYAIAYPSPEEHRNICTLLKSNNPLVKLFVLFDVRVIAWYDATRREDVFALSKPAGNARNWKSIFNPCHQILEAMKDKIDEARNKLAGIDNKEAGDAGSDEDYVNRTMLLMPQSSRDQLYSAYKRNRRQSLLKPQQIIVPIEKKTIAETISNLTKTTDETGLISRLETEMTVLAIEILEMLVIHSISSDRYGVLQKDLTTIMGDILSLHTSIDRYLRTKGFAITPVDNEGFLRSVEDVLVSTMTHIAEKFTSDIRCFGYNAQQTRQFETIISQSSINTHHL